MAATIRARRSPCLRHRTSGAAETPQALRRSEKSLRDNPHPDFSNCSHTTPVSTTLVRSFHLRWKQVPDPTHHSRKWAFSLLDTGFRHGPRGPTHESNHKADRFANVRVLATWTLFESEFCPNRFKRLGIRPIQSENFSLGMKHGSQSKSGQSAGCGRAFSAARRPGLLGMTVDQRRLPRQPWPCQPMSRTRSSAPSVKRARQLRLTTRVGTYWRVVSQVLPVYIDPAVFTV